jgi:N-hydroxyarylamine O-acetyltransferase
VEPFTLTPARRDQYLRRLGWEGALAPDLATLQALSRRHLRAVPFENLDIHLGVPIELDIDRILAKVLDQRRGGFCFELNSSFAALLGSIGFDVTLLEARVYESAGDPVPFGHLALRVDLDEPYLADVGFGRGFDEPIRFEERGDQVDTGGVFRLAEERDGELDLVRDGVPMYQLSPVPRAFAEFADACRWHQTSPDSIFTQGTVCTRRTERGRCTLAASTFIETVDGVRSEVVIDDPEEVRETLAATFGIELPLTAIDELLSGRRRPGFASNW